MTYQQILDRITDELGLTVLSSRQISVIRRDIFDVITLVMRKAENNRALYEFDVVEEYDVDGNGNVDNIYVPSNFYAPLEVIFTATNGLTIMSKEVTWEKYSRWNPNITLITTSFVELVTAATPQSIMWTQENEDLDGCVAFCFLDTEPIKMVWKPPVAATVKLLYVVRPTTAITNLATSPPIHSSFHSETIVSGVMLKLLVRKLKDIKTEVELFAIREQLRHHGAIYKEGIADLAGHVEKTAEVAVVEPFEFLNDPNMRV